MKDLAIYLHIPFCKRKCAYCDFASWSGREGQWRQYFDALVTEIRHWSEITDFGLLKDRFLVKTLFIGGGTPTLVAPEYISELIRACRGLARFSEDIEITLEGNPGTISPDKLAVYRRAGVNRLSLGAQSFDDGLLESLGRIHTAKEIVESVHMARDAGFDNLNLDLMYALPGQSVRQWLDTLERAIETGVEHLSAYSLIVEEGTPMASRVMRGEAVMPDDEAVNAMQRAAIDRLSRAGYCRYEISNYAKPGRACRHNLVYWNRGDYLGLGCAAHSMVDECRFCNPATLEDYLSGARREDFQRLTRQDAMEETVMLSTRTTRGLDLAAWRLRYGRPFERGRERVIERLRGAGLIDVSDGHLSLTTTGMEVQNAVVLELLEEREET